MKETALKFVVQKHDARRLHYDFRLEMEGVLKSWAVPKGPSLDPSVKRLAIAVEDHDLDYADFEGTIEEGQYGAGSVERWDAGTVEYKNGPGQAPRDLEAGLLVFTLNGEKLKGAWKLIKVKAWQENSWLLIKRRDEAAIPAAPKPKKTKP
ncbi:MAG: DNA polymerase ligase N-terminal domain-containing protein [Phycisphaerae bacterium]|nr:DNA polymerase ligase N-terminal domain-containing protein [Phycisphaerae bacterium]